MEYQKSLIAEDSSHNGLEAWQQYNNGSIFIPSVEDRHIEVLLSIERTFGSFVIKMHRPPEDATKRLVREFNAKVTVCFRDPRDIVLSAIDHGVRTRRGEDPSGAFGDIHSVEDGAKAFKLWSKIYYGWKEFGEALIIRYEDLMRDGLSSLRQLVDFLGLAISEEVIREIRDEHERKKTSAWNFNKGTSERWRSEMSLQQLATCNEMLADDITRMGYVLGS
jgi:hypothetical protein